MLTSLGPNLPLFNHKRLTCMMCNVHCMGHCPSSKKDPPGDINFLDSSCWVLTLNLCQNVNLHTLTEF